MTCTVRTGRHAPGSSDISLLTNQRLCCIGLMRRNYFHRREIRHGKASHSSGNPQVSSKYLSFLYNILKQQNKFLSIVFLHQSHFFCIILYTVSVYSILTQLFQPLMTTSFVWSKYWANIFVNLSSPISLAFNFKCYFILLILINDKIRVFSQVVTASGPCKNCQPIRTQPAHTRTLCVPFFQKYWRRLFKIQLSYFIFGNLDFKCC